MNFRSNAPPLRQEAGSESEYQSRQRAAHFVHPALERGTDPAGSMGGGRNGLERLHVTPENHV